MHDQNCWAIGKLAMTLNSPRASKRRRGAVLIAVMVCLGVFMVLCAVMLKTMLLGQRQQRMQEWRAQAEWLAESGIERARAQLGHSAEYSGESWQIAESELSPDATGLIVIEVIRAGGQPDRPLVRVRAEYLRGGERRVRCSKEIQMSISNKSTEGTS